MFTKGDAAVLAVLYHGLIKGDVFWVKLGGVELPGGASLEVSAGVVGGIVFEDELFLIPSGEVTKEDDGFPVGVNSCFFQSGEAFFANFTSRGSSVVRVGMVSFDKMDFQLSRF